MEAEASASSGRVLLLPGDGIGPEVVAEARKVGEAVAPFLQRPIQFKTGLIGGCAVEVLGKPLPEATLADARQSDAILLGAVGGPKYETLARELRPERGLLAIRSELGLFANLRPAKVFSSLVHASSLKPELLSGLDILIVRELTGGIYFGEPRGRRKNDHGEEAFNTMIYDSEEIERVVRVACEAAHKRGGRVCSVDKANVLEVSELWREVAKRTASDYVDVEMDFMYVDNAAMQLVRDPRQFDVIVTANLFGDILSDLAAMLTGSIGMLPSASLACSGAGLFEPVHGSAPELAGRNIANPLAAILSFAMLLRYSLGEEEAARRVENAVDDALEEGMTIDLADDKSAVSCSEMGDLVVHSLAESQLYLREVQEGKI